jgi:DNA-binding NarL/FixJ family response regulator
MESLTPREVEVLRLLSQGQTNPQIAQNLLVSRGTVKIHVQHIISKLGVSGYSVGEREGRRAFSASNPGVQAAGEKPSPGRRGMTADPAGQY